MRNSLFYVISQKGLLYPIAGMKHRAMKIISPLKPGYQFLKNKGKS